MVGLAVAFVDTIKFSTMMYSNAVEIYERKWIENQYKASINFNYFGYFWQLDSEIYFSNPFWILLLTLISFLRPHFPMVYLES